MHKCKHVQLQTEKRKVKTQCLQLHLLNGQKYHGLRSSASPVLTATGLVNGRWQFLRPTESTPLDRSTKKFGTGDYVSDPYGCVKFGANPSIGGFWANGIYITKILKIY